MINPRQRAIPWAAVVVMLLALGPCAHGDIIYTYHSNTLQAMIGTEFEDAVLFS
jgi:hypothetical protein